MRKTAFIIISVAAVLTASAQEGTKFYPEGTTWVDAYVSINSGVPCRLDAYEVGGDTVLNGKTYSKVLNNGDPWEWLLREEAPAKVYLRSIYDEYEFLAYDFEWAEGKEISHGYADPMYGETSFVISGIGQATLMDGSSCDCIGVLDEDGDFMLRGIGSGSGIFVPFFELPPDGTVPRLYSFTRGGTLLYQYGGALPVSHPTYYTDGVVWTEKRADGEATVVDTYEIEGDTTFAGSPQLYKKISRNGGLWEWAVREDESGKVYLRAVGKSPAAGSEFLAYDFGWDEGEELPYCVVKPYYVYNTYYIQDIGRMALLDGSDCAVLPDFNGTGNSLMHVIGETAGIFSGFKDDGAAVLQSFTRDGVVLYQKGMSALSKPKEGMVGYAITRDGQSYTVTAASDFDAVVYDLSGRMLSYGCSSGCTFTLSFDSLPCEALLRLQGDAGTETLKLIK